MCVCARSHLLSFNLFTCGFVFLILQAMTIQRWMKQMVNVKSQVQVVATILCTF